MGYFNEQGTKATWSNPQIVPESQRQNGGWYYNPSTGSVDRWWAGTPSQASVTSQPSQQTESSNVASNYVGAATAAVDPLLEAEKKISSYLKGKYGDNWYDVDEEQYRAAAQEQYDPYYQAELGDYMTGISRQRQRGQADEEKLRGELTTQTENYVGRAKREIDAALESSGEGFAGAGLYFSGKRMKREGEIGIQGEENIRDFTRQQDLKTEESMTRQSRNLEDLASSERTYKRNWTADRETALRQNMLQSKEEENKRRMLEATQYAGGDYASTLQNRLLGLS